MKIIGLESISVDFLSSKIKILVDETFDITIDRYIGEVIGTPIEGLHVYEDFKLAIIPFNNDHANEVRCKALQSALSGLDLDELDIEIMGYKPLYVALKNWGFVIRLKSRCCYFISTMSGNFIILSDTSLAFGNERKCNFSPVRKVIFEMTDDGKFIKY